MDGYYLHIYIYIDRKSVIGETCTAGVKRAQLLGNVHNISDSCTTSLKRAAWKHWLGAVKHTIPTYIYIYINNIVFVCGDYFGCECKPPTRMLITPFFCTHHELRSPLEKQSGKSSIVHLLYIHLVILIFGRGWKPRLPWPRKHTKWQSMVWTLKPVHCRKCGIHRCLRTHMV